jgi:glycosyltransferase involved in cell wall biosynthesis
LNFHIEAVFPRQFSLAGRNIFIPNQDWFRESSRQHLVKIDSIFAKTRYAERLFSATGPKTAFIGWLSTDKYDADQVKTRSMAALHVAGSSTEKGTESVLDRWELHPEWPVLTVVRAKHHYTGAQLPWKPRSATRNIHLIEERITESELKALQNTHWLHVCPSAAEGYGHIIAEAMSVGAIVITTDGPPMNELVASDRGLLVSIARAEPMGLGSRYTIDPSDFDMQINRALHMPSQELLALGASARAWFLDSISSFPRRLDKEISQVLDT